MSAIDVNHVIAAGMSVLDTTTGGGTMADWTVEIPANPNDCTQIQTFGQFVDPTHAWVVDQSVNLYYFGPTPN